MALNRDNYLITLLLDLAKAFDTVDHEIQLSKLYRLGVSGRGLVWVRLYLPNRHQYICFYDVNFS